MLAGSIWWNHLLGGARRWAILSGQLASQLVDQADAAAGIAFLTRDWAEMARRSLVALDQDRGPQRFVTTKSFDSRSRAGFRRNYVAAGELAYMSWRGKLRAGEPYRGIIFMILQKFCRNSACSDFELWQIFSRSIPGTWGVRSKLADLRQELEEHVIADKC